MHIQGYFRDQLNSRQRGELREVILNYRAGLLPILAPLTLLKHYLAEYPDRYLQAQNYFDPYPQDLALRLTVNGWACAGLRGRISMPPSGRRGA
jgi:uncharacterized protein YbgA (DUF1722 family)